MRNLAVSAGLLWESARHYGRVMREPSGQMPLRLRFAHGAAWSVVAAGIAQSLGLPLAVITARLLGSEGFGALSLIQGTVSMLGVVAGMGLGSTAIKYVSELRTTNPRRSGHIVGLSLV